MIQEAVFVCVFPIVDAQERKSSDRPYNYQQRINAYDTVLNAVEIQVQWRSNFKSSPRVLKKVS